jgi:hypothetical protein
MGGNNSRSVNPNGEDVLPARLRPLLRQRIEEFRKRRNARRDDAVSKKELLKDDAGNNDDRSSNVNEVLEETRQHEEEKTTVHAVTVEKLSQVAPLPVSECGIEEEEHKGSKDHNLEKCKEIERNVAEVKIAASLQENKYEESNEKHDDEDKKEEEEEEEEDEEEDENEIGRLIGPGSPSFRIYYIEATERKEQELRDTRVSDKQQGEKEDEPIAVHYKSHSCESDESATSASENTDNSNEVIKLFSVHLIDFPTL